MSPHSFYVYLNNENLPAVSIKKQAGTKLLAIAKNTAEAKEMIAEYLAKGSIELSAGAVKEKQDAR